MRVGICDATLSCIRSGRTRPTFTAQTTRPQPSGLGGWRTATRFNSGGWSPNSNLAIRSTDPSGGEAPAHQCTELD